MAPDTTRLGDDEAALLRTRMRDRLDVLPGYGAFFKPAFLLRKRFHSVVFGGDFRDADEGVSGLCRGLSIASVFCLNVDDDGRLPAFRFVPTHDNLKAVRNDYHTPSYAIGDDSGTFMIVSDSDYYWGFAAAPKFVGRLAIQNNSLRQMREDLRGYLESEYEHDRRIGAMLSSFLKVCDGAAAAVA